MVRATSRAKEYSLRQVLGAGRHQLVRALMVESLLVASTGGLMGVGLAMAVLSSTAKFAATRLPADVVLRLDATVCVSALGASVLLGILLALPVIWLTVHGNLAAALTVESRGGTTTRSVHRLRHTLIVAQIALAFVLLSSAGLLGLSFIRVMEVKPGFQRENLVSGVVTLPWWKGYRDPGQQVTAMRRVFSSVQSMPGATSVAISQGLPFGNRSWVEAWSIAGNTTASDEFIKEGLFANLVSGGYFETLGIPLVEGRFLNDDDVQLKRKVCVVDEEFARRHWPRGGAIGNRLAQPYDPQGPKPEIYTIVGVVGSVKQDDLADRQAHAAGYFPIQDLRDFMVTVRTRLAPAAAISSLREAVMRVDPGLVLYDLQPMASRIDGSLSKRRTPLALAAIFAGVSLVLAAVGIYGVLAYSVAQRRREIGVRMALGAQPAQILRQFLGLGVRLLLIGLPIGVLGAWMAGHAIAGMLFGVEPLSPQVLGATAAVLVAAALPACLLPSRRAAHVAPNEALRAD
jgi:predicted permease